jgi:hypothetical protein
VHFTRDEPNARFIVQTHRYRPHHGEPAFDSIRSSGLRELEKIGKRKELRAIFVRLTAPIVCDRMGMVLDLDL